MRVATKQTTEVPRSLWWLHLSACGLHLLLFLVSTILLGLSWNSALRLPVIMFGGSSRSAEDVTLTFVIRESPVGVIIPIFFLLTVVEHLVYVLFWSWYRQCVVRTTNPCRWIFYSISASLMFVLILQVSGNFSLITMIYGFEMTGVVMFFGYLIELLYRHVDELESLHPQKNISSLKFWMIQIPFEITVVAWIGVWAQSLSNAAQVPVWVWPLIVVTFCSWLSFGFVPLYTFVWAERDQYQHRFIQGEYIYAGLSLIAKASLGIIFLGATFQS